MLPRARPHKPERASTPPSAGTSPARGAVALSVMKFEAGCPLLLGASASGSDAGPRLYTLCVAESWSPAPAPKASPNEQTRQGRQLFTLLVGRKSVEGRLRDLRPLL